MRPIRFCMLTTFYPPAGFGGDAVQVKRLCSVLADRGHHVTVVHSLDAFRALGGRSSPRAVHHPGVRVVSVDAGMSALSPLTTHLTGHPLFTSRKLRRVLDADFDVLHFHNPSLLGGPALLAMGTGIKLYTAHEQWLVCPTHTLWKYQKRICEKPQCWRCLVAYRRPPQLWRQTNLLERSLAQVDALITPSRTSMRLHERFAPEARIEQLSHCVPDGLEPSGAETVPKRPYFLFVGRLEPIKGVQTLLDAFRRQHPADLLIAGTGSLERSLRSAAADLPHVRFLGWVSPERLSPLYRQALAVIVPTLGHESFGLVAAEAFASGTPAIVRRFGALAELVDESEAGIAYSSEQELDQAIARLASDEELRSELGARGRAAYRERWSSEAHLRGYFSLIAELARGRGNEELAVAAAASAAQEARLLA